MRSFMLLSFLPLGVLSAVEPLRSVVIHNPTTNDWVQEAFAVALPVGTDVSGQFEVESANMDGVQLSNVVTGKGVPLVWFLVDVPQQSSVSVDIFAQRLGSTPAMAAVSGIQFSENDDGVLAQGTGLGAGFAIQLLTKVSEKNTPVQCLVVGDQVIGTGRWGEQGEPDRQVIVSVQQSPVMARYVLRSE